MIVRVDFARFSAILVAAFFLLGMGGRPQKPPESGNTDVPSAAAANRPEPELLEYLADFQTDKGRFIDPMALEALMPQLARGKDDD